MEAYCKCERCGREVKVDTSAVLTSNPPKYKYECSACNHVGYIDTAIVYGGSKYQASNRSIQSDSCLTGNYNINQDCHSCDHQAVCRYKEEFLKKLNALDIKSEPFIRLRCECIHYKQQTYNYREITWLNSSDSINQTLKYDKDRCGSCDFMQKLIHDGTYIGDSPCEWCSSNPYKVSSISGVTNIASTSEPKAKSVINESISDIKEINNV